MEEQIHYPESIGLHTPEFVVEKIGEIDERSVITRVNQSCVLGINNAVFLGKIGIKRLEPRYIGIIPDKRLVIKHEIARKYGNVGNNDQDRNHTVMGESATHEASMKPVYPRPAVYRSVNRPLTRFYGHYLLTDSQE